MMEELIEGVLDDLCYDVRLKVEQQEALLKKLEKRIVGFLGGGGGGSYLYVRIVITDWASCFGVNNYVQHSIQTMD